MINLLAVSGGYFGFEIPNPLFPGQFYSFSFQLKLHHGKNKTKECFENPDTFNKYNDNVKNMRFV